MRVAVVHSYYGSEQPSGENVVVDAQAAALRDAGYTVEVFSRSTDEAKDQFAYRLRSAGRVLTGRGAGMGAELDAFGPDVVHVHNLFPNIPSGWLHEAPGALVLTIHNYRFVCAAATLFRDGAPCTECVRRPVLPAVVHGCYRNRPASIPGAVAAAPRIGSASRLLDAADSIVCLNDYAETLLRARVRRGDAVRQVPNFVQPPDEQPPAVGTEIDALVIGRLDEEKGIPWLLEAWPESRRLTIIGDGPCRPEVQRAAAARANVEYVGMRARPEVFALLRSARVLVVPSMLAEGLPTVVLEALSVGLPVVLSSRVAAAPGLAGRGLAHVFSPEAGAASLTEALTAAEVDVPGQASRARAAFEEHYSRTAWLRSISEVYEDAVARRRDAS